MSGDLFEEEGEMVEIRGKWQKLDIDFLACYGSSVVDKILKICKIVTRLNRYV